MIRTGFFLLLAALAGMPSASEAATPASARGAVSPAAPVQLTYAMPAQAVAGRRFTIDLSIATPLHSGKLQLEVAKAVGVTLADDARRTVDLASDTRRPLPLAIDVLPGTEAERYLVLLVSVDTAMGRMSRSFRVSLPEAPASGAQPPAPDAGEGVKILPANPAP